MHDPVPQTGQRLKPVVQGCLTYYAVPGNLASLGAFWDRVLALVANHSSPESEAPDLGRASPSWLSDGFLNRERSIPLLTLASPPAIRDKNRIR